MAEETKNVKAGEKEEVDGGKTDTREQMGKCEEPEKKKGFSNVEFVLIVVGGLLCLAIGELTMPMPYDLFMGPVVNGLLLGVSAMQYSMSPMPFYRQPTCGEEQEKMNG